MKRLLILLTLPILACGGGNGIVAPTGTPLSPPTVDSAPQTESQPEPATPTETEPPTASVVQFPDPNNFTWLPIVSGLDRPVAVQSAHDGSGRLFIIEKYGAIRIFKDGQLYSQPFLSIDDRVNDDSNEMGLLGLAFDPNYASNGYFYVNYTGNGGHTLFPYTTLFR